jgi:hypothetical protein
VCKVRQAASDDIHVPSKILDVCNPAETTQTLPIEPVSARELRQPIGHLSFEVDFQAVELRKAVFGYRRESEGRAAAKYYLLRSPIEAPTRSAARRELIQRTSEHSTKRAQMVVFQQEIELGTRLGKRQEPVVSFECRRDFITKLS